LATHTLSDVRSRVRDTANITSNRISDTRLNEIINDGIKEITSSNRLRFAEKSLTVLVTTGTTIYQPADTEGPVEYPVLWTYSNPTTNQITEIKQTTIEGLRTLYLDPYCTQIGLPQYYAPYGEANEQPQLQVWPVPQSNLTTNLDCRIKFYDLSNDTDSNSVTTGAYEALTYLTLLLAAPYMENDDRIDTWDRMYQRASSRLMRSHSHARYSGSQQRSMREPG
jgi:hypothetical protein